MHIQQHINLGLVDLLAERNEEFAFPTRIIYVERIPDDSATPPTKLMP